MTNLKTVNLLQNGEKFNPNTYSDIDNIDAYLVCENDLVNIRVSDCMNEDEVSINILSDKKQMNQDFLEFIENFEEDYDARKYVINSYQEYLYPFVYDDEITDFNLMVKWVYENIDNEKSIHLCISSYSLTEKKIVINKNDMGVIVDYYDDIHDEPLNTKTFYFEDFISSWSK